MNKAFLIVFGIIFFTFPASQTMAAKKNECVELSGNAECRQVEIHDGPDFTIAQARSGAVAIFTEAVQAGPGATCIYIAESGGSPRHLMVRLLLPDGVVRDVQIETFSRGGKWRQREVAYTLPVDFHGNAAIAFYEYEDRGRFFVREGARAECTGSGNVGPSAALPAIGDSFGPSFFLPREIDLSSYKQVVATIFWVGEEPSDDNGHISNSQSAWDSFWQESFGGFDDPEDRCGYHPCAFTPLENPFYVALPYNDVDFDGNRKPTASLIPWFDEYSHLVSVMKNRWVEIRANDNVCYGQVEDSGPNVYDDFDYVFGDQSPQNPFGVQAGIDLSPALKTCLEIGYAEEVEWRFVADDEVPEGPWQEIVTTRGVNWE